VVFVDSFLRDFGEFLVRAFKGCILEDFWRAFMGDFRGGFQGVDILCFF
jgi:hypothetical protein